jgi:hypothetical protein
MHRALMFVFAQIKSNFKLQVVCASLTYPSSLYPPRSPNEARYVLGPTNSQVGSMDGHYP